MGMTTNENVWQQALWKTMRNAEQMDHGVDE